MGLVLPNAYDRRMEVRTTQEAIKYIRDTFQKRNEPGEDLRASVRGKKQRPE